MPDDQAKIARRAQAERQDVAAAIRDCIDDWIAAVNESNADHIGALYVQDAVLLGTFDPSVSTTPERRLNYFINFKTRKKLKAAIDECHIKDLGDDAGMANGLYTFRFIDDSGAPQTVKARFTFVCERQPEGDWLIVAHHSSVLPFSAPQKRN
jgi:uncharacterized protein (TIGR02246 family)